MITTGSIRTMSTLRASERYVATGWRFSPHAVREIHSWVRSQTEEQREQPLYKDAIERFRRSVGTNHLVLFTGSACAEIPEKQRYDVVFPLDRSGEAEPVNLVLDHIVMELGTPQSSTTVGWKHIFFLRSEGPMPRCISTLREAAQMDDVTFGAELGLCTTADWPAIRRRELIDVYRDVRPWLAREKNEFAGTPWKCAADALRDIDRLVDELERGILPDRWRLEWLFVPGGPLQDVSVRGGWAAEYMKLASRFDVVIERVAR